MRSPGRDSYPYQPRSARSIRDVRRPRVELEVRLGDPEGKQIGPAEELVQATLIVGEAATAAWRTHSGEKEVPMADGASPRMRLPHLG